MDSIISTAELSPRLVRLLELLLRQSEPIKVDALAQALSVSRRTVFRQLENAEPVLSAAHTTVVSIPGRGIALSCGAVSAGDGEPRRQLLDALSSYITRPATKKERLLRLLIELITHAGKTQKYFSCAAALGVSESTVSHDLDELEPSLAETGLVLTRKSGLGVQLDGTEENLRTALVSRFMRDGDTGGKSYTAVFDFPGDDIEAGVREILRRQTGVIDWMTPESVSFFSLYLMILVERVYDGNIIVSAQTPAGGFHTALAYTLAAEITTEFSITLPETERLALARWIQSCRSKRDIPLEPGPEEQRAVTQNLTLDMIDRFDPVIAAVLKTNEQLVRFLSRHLESACLRLKDGKFLPNPLEPELIQNYPDVYEKTKTAARALEEYLGVPIPSNEVSFIQIHFLSALAFLGDRNVKRRLLRAGVVCVSGIGTSYMLLYQIRKRFKGELEVEIADHGDRASWTALDFLISTIPLDESEKPFVRVQTILGEKDFQKIQETVNALAFTKRGVEQPGRSPSFEKRLDSMIDIFMQSRKLLAGFAVESIKGDCTFDELARFASARFAPENPEAVYHALTAREAVTSQVVGELGIVLLHTWTANNATPVFAVIVPEGGVFTGDYFRQTRSCVVMLLPASAPREMTELIGGISGALIDMPAFLEAVRAGNQETIKAVLEQEIAEIIARCTGEK